jgi:predicted ATPase/DNA-binding CsgD family transcriptional regulator
VLVGRDDVLDLVVSRLTRDDVVSVVGPGGVGKTAVARQVLRRVARDGEHQQFVDLAPVPSPVGVLEVVAHALGVREEAGVPLETAVVEAAAHASVLVLDNCEHVLAGVVPLVTRLRGRVAILCTSREPLNLPGEIVVRLAPLAVDAPDAPAVALFLDRARAASPTAELGADVETIQRICAAVGGLPLGIELAAARAAAVPLVDLADRLEMSLRPLRPHSAHGADLEDSLGWSVDALPDAAREVLAALTVFPGAFTVAAAEEITGASVDAVAALVERSLLLRDGDGYRLLPPVRQVVLNRAAPSTETRRRHHLFVLALVVAAEEVGDLPSFERLEHHDRDLEAAFDWLVRTRQWDAASELCRRAGRSHFWARGEIHRTRRWARALLENDLPPLVRARMLIVLGAAVAETGARDDAMRYVEEGERAARDLGAPSVLGDALIRLGGLGGPAGFDRLEEGLALGADVIGRYTYYWGVALLIRRLGEDLRLGEAADLAAREHDRCLREAPVSRQAVVLEMAGTVATWRGRIAEALDYFDEAVERAFTPGLLAVCTAARSLALSYAGRTADAVTAARHAYELSSPRDAASVVSWCESYLAAALLRHGQVDEAEDVLRGAIAGRWKGLRPYHRVQLAHCSLHRGDLAGAVREVAAADADEIPMGPRRHLELDLVRAAVEAPKAPIDARNRLLRVAQAAIAGDAMPVVFDAFDQLAHLATGADRADEAERLAATAAAGRRDLGMAHASDVDLDKAVPPTDMVRLLVRGRGSRRRPAFGWESLTPTEREVAEHIASGRTNPEIASSMFISAGTVKVHVSRILTKLGVRSRAEIAAQVAAKPGR